MNECFISSSTSLLSTTFWNAGIIQSLLTITKILLFLLCLGKLMNSLLFYPFYVTQLNFKNSASCLDSLGIWWWPSNSISNSNRLCSNSKTNWMSFCRERLSWGARQKSLWTRKFSWSSIVRYCARISPCWIRHFKHESWTYSIRQSMWQHFFERSSRPYKSQLRRRAPKKRNN